MLFLSLFVNVESSIPEAQEAFKTLPGTRGSALPEYEPMASHGDPVGIQNYFFYKIQRIGNQ